MRSILLASLLSGVFAAICAGQSSPAPGSLIFMCSDPQFLSGRAFCVSTLGGQCTTLALPPSGFVFRGARMAPNNRDIVTATLKPASSSANNIGTDDSERSAATHRSYLARPAPLAIVGA